MIDTMSPYAWDTVQRMHAAGCPMDMARLRRRLFPLGLRVLSALTLHPVDGGFALAGEVQLVPRAAVRIASYHMEATWMSAGVEWAGPCTRHPGNACVHPLSFSAKRTLIDRLSAHLWWLKPGIPVRGQLLGLCQAAPPAGFDFADLTAVFKVEDVDGYCFHFPVSLSWATRTNEGREATTGTQST